MFELHQFKHSAFCLKVRMGLEAKQLDYKLIEVIPGIGQVAIFRLSGQRQVPVLIDDDNVISDSSSIIRYIDEKNLNIPLIPEDPKIASQVYLIEDWADTTLANAARAALLQAAAKDTQLREALLPNELPEPFRQMVGNFPCDFISDFSQLINQREREDLITSLKQLSILVQKNSWLVGSTMSVADLAVAAQLSLLSFPESSGEELAGHGVPGLRDDPTLQPLFDWRNQLEDALKPKNRVEVQ